ncbi:MAG: ParB/RepB/Spo0J family partition protein [Nitrospirae bacterium]|nr:ParB/RepB/Spo0J family partition protein [Nitrospirota bacterium]MBF0535816.1 ParB/RepB/Spo0J family partition protein [Nitrospirota bacterium]MBF0617719.1 ParB/RepB/Spo0J family partition protein [Nitrospirota bacterium]
MKKALGRGLDALIPTEGEEIHQIEIEKIFPNPSQPRKHFSEESLNQLAESISQQGIIQPIIVARTGDGTFTIVAGERRWRAATISGSQKIPCIIRDESAEESFEISLIENIQREELNPIETATAFLRIMEEQGITQEELSKKIGKQRATVANYVRLLTHPEEIKSFIISGALSMGHAKVLLSLKDQSQQLEAAQMVVKNSLSVRETEALCKKLSTDSTSSVKKPEPPKDPHIAGVEDELTRNLGTKVRIHHKGNTGRIEIDYYTMDDLNRIIDILKI